MSHYEMDLTKIMIVTQLLSPESQHRRDQGRGSPWGLKRD